MTVTRAPRIVDGLILYGDQAYSTAEWERRNQQMTRRRDRRRVSTDPQRVAKAAYMRDWRRRNPERWQEIQDASRRHGRLVGSLHSVSCTGPIRATGCRCHKIRCYSKPPSLRVIADELLRRSDVEPA